jgi:putative flavoprotein involved in K+ transport
VDLAAAGITSVVWAVGFQSDYSWVKVPTFDGGGHPAHNRGVSAVPGVYFLGLPWLHTWGSGRFAGIARDAAYLAETIVDQGFGAKRVNDASVSKQPVPA